MMRASKSIHARLGDTRIRHARLGTSRLGNERGEIASTLIIFLVIVAFFMLTVHAMFLFHGNNLVHAAAQDALVAAQIEGGSRASAEQKANERLDLFPGLTNRSVQVMAPDGSDTITVVVKAQVTTPFLNAVNTMEATAVGTRERFYEEWER